jgi:hypothetical protein
VSGTVHCGNRLEDWCRVLRGVLRTDAVAMLGHYTGAVSVYAFSPVADVVSCGFEIHEAWVLAPGDRSDWVRFTEILGSALTAAGLPHSLVVHDAMLVLE